MAEPRTLFEKIWARRRVLERPDGQTLLYVDTHLVHDGSAPLFQTLRNRGVAVRVPSRTFATPDHYVLTNTRRVTEIPDPERLGMVEQLIANTKEAGVTMFGLDDPRPAPPDTPSNTPAARSAGCPWRAASRSATCR